MYSAGVGATNAALRDAIRCRVVPDKEATPNYISATSASGSRVPDAGCRRSIFRETSVWEVRRPTRVSTKRYYHRTSVGVNGARNWSVTFDIIVDYRIRGGSLISKEKYSFSWGTYGHGLLIEHRNETISRYCQRRVIICGRRVLVLLYHPGRIE